MRIGPCLPERRLQPAIRLQRRYGANAVALPSGGQTTRYPKLLARIRLLQAEAERARQREAAVAIESMKRDIALYGLTAEDLGFR